MQYMWDQASLGMFGNHKADHQKSICRGSGSPLGQLKPKAETKSHNEHDLTKKALILVLGGIWENNSISVT